MADKIRVKITGVNFAYDSENVNVETAILKFELVDPINQFYGNGSVNMPKEDYFNNTEGMPGLEKFTRSYLVGRFNDETAKTE